MNSENLSINQKRELKEILKNIKSIFILKKVFNNLQRNKYLKIIKCNRNIQKYLNLNINNYKEYTEIYSKIKLELIPIKNNYSYFINILKEEDEKYYHIYFNDSNKEIKGKQYLTKSDKLPKIKIIIDYQIKSFEKIIS